MDDTKRTQVDAVDIDLSKPLIGKDALFNDSVFTSRKMDIGDAVVQTQVVKPPKDPSIADMMHQSYVKWIDPVVGAFTDAAAMTMDIGAEIVFPDTSPPGTNKEYVSDTFNRLHNMPEEGYVPITPEIAETWSPRYWDRIMETKNSGERDKLFQQILDEEHASEVLSRGGWTGTAIEFGAGVIGSLPTLIIPAFQSTRYATLGVGALKNIAKATSVSAASSALNTSILYAQKETWNQTDALINFTADFIGMQAFAGVAGANKASAVTGTKAYFQSLFKDVDIVAKLKPDGTFDKFIAQSNNLSSAESVSYVQRQINKSIDGIPEKGFLGKAFDLTFGQSPVIRAARSPIPAVREWGDGLFFSRHVTGEVAAGKAKKASAEVISEAWHGRFNSGIAIQKQAFKKYLTAQKGVFEKQGKALGYQEFCEDIGKAMRRGDKGMSAEATEMAGWWRKNLYDPLKNAMVKHGFLDPDVEVNTAISYMTRSYNREMIVARRADFAKILGDYFHGNEKLGNAEIQDLVDVTINTILGESDEQLTQSIFGAVTAKAKTGANPGQLKERTLLIPDELIEDFLESDIRKLAYNYQTNLGRIDGFAEFTKNAFGKSMSIEDGKAAFITRLTEDYKTYERARIGDKTGKEAEKIRLKVAKEKKDSINFLEESLQVYMGNYARASTEFKKDVQAGLNTLRTLTAISRLPFLATTMLTEFAAPMFKNGPGLYIKSNLKPMMKNLSGLANRDAAIRASAADVGLGLNTMTAKWAQTNLGKSYGDANLYDSRSAWGRFVQRVGKLSGNLNMSNQFQDIQETLAVNTVQSRIIRTLEGALSGKGLLKKDKEFLNQIGINIDKDGPILVGQSKQFGYSVDGAWNPNITKWDMSANAASVKMRQAVWQGVQLSLPKKSRFDVPLAFNDPAFATATQFMSWYFTAQNTFLVPLLQRADIDKAIGLTAMTAMGSLVYPLKQIQKGKEINWDHFMEEAMNNSGWFQTWHMDAARKVASVFDFKLLENEKYRQARERGNHPIAIASGPSGGYINDLFDVGGMVLNSEMNEQDAKKAIHMLPFLNSPGVNTLMNQWIESFNMPKNKSRARKQNSQE